MYQVLKYINENLCEELHLADTSKHFGFSKWYFCERFKQYTGQTFTEYVRRRRMQLASAELLAGEKVTEVAVKYGYESPGGFNKAFLREFGCIPTEFKQNENYYRHLYEERKLRMFTLSDRCAALRGQAMNEKPYNALLLPQREYYFTLGAAKAQMPAGNSSLVAAGLSNVILNFPALVADGEILVGHNYADPEPYMPYTTDEAFVGWLAEAGFSKEETGGYFAARQRFRTLLTHYPPPVISEKAQLLGQEMAASGYCLTFNHSVIGYEKVVRLGFLGIQKEIEGYITPENKDFYAPMLKICGAAATLGERYAEKVEEEIAKGGHTPARLSELESMKKACLQVPRHPARSFLEAAQSLLFAHIINTWEDGINANSLGRLDQILYPYYKADMEKGVITKSEAFEIICCLWIKLYRDYDVQQSCVGGCDLEGNPAVNELSYLMLDATQQLDFIRCLSVRFDKNTEKAFVTRALEVVGDVQKGVPFFFNDEVMVPALTRRGIDIKDARDYTQIGCVETVIPGKSNPHAVTARCNVLKALEYALYNGGSGLDKTLRPGLATGEASGLTDYTQLEGAVLKQLSYLLDVACQMTANDIERAGKTDPKPFKSMLTEGCLETGKDFNMQGAKYDYYQVMLIGLPNLADSLAAVKKLVFSEKRYTMEEVLWHLENNFPKEDVRLDFVNKAPKFGNDINEVDEIAAHMMDFCCEELERLSKKYKREFHAQPFSFLTMVEHGQTTGATPDGRRSGEILAYSVSPMQGRDFNGFTALTNSLAKLPAVKAPGTTSAILEADPALFTRKNIPHFTDILLAAAGKGLCNVQFNVVDADTLIDAQKYPDKHRNLAVRVSGFSQKFYLLDKHLQDHIIARTKHKYM